MLFSSSSLSSSYPSCPLQCSRLKLKKSSSDIFGVHASLCPCQDRSAAQIIPRHASHLGFVRILCLALCRPIPLVYAYREQVISLISLLLLAAKTAFSEVAYFLFLFLALLSPPLKRTFTIKRSTYSSKYHNVVSTRENHPR